MNSLMVGAGDADVGDDVRLVTAYCRRGAVGLGARRPVVARVGRRGLVVC